jgi:sodium-dependent dicarboxylate transporter 2/3/5
MADTGVLEAEDVRTAVRAEPHGTPSAPDPEDDGQPIWARKLGLIVGLGAFVVMRIVPGPASLPPEGWAAASVMALMAVWWLSEAVPIAVTALVPLVLFPMLGLMTMQEAAAPFSNEVIFLFMGGFFLAKSMERWGLHRRIALAIVASMGTCFVSMWISNTSTAAMMLAPGLAVAGMLRPTEGPGATGKYNFGIALMLGIAYASSIGGVGTLIGTPPNVLFAASALELANVRVGFLQWMMVATPFAWIMLVLTWLILVRVYPGVMRQHCWRISAGVSALCRAANDSWPSYSRSPSSRG